MTNEQVIRKTKIKHIKVTTLSGKIFDGDEASQNRITKKVLSMEFNGLTTTVWKLADNTKPEVTIQELREALALADTEHSRLWMEI